jgi:hypothetical protein
VSKCPRVPSASNVGASIPSDEMSFSTSNLEFCYEAICFDCLTVLVLPSILVSRIRIPIPIVVPSEPSYFPGEQAERRGRTVVSTVSKLYHVQRAARRGGILRRGDLRKLFVKGARLGRGSGRRSAVSKSATNVVTWGFTARRKCAASSASPRKEAAQSASAVRMPSQNCGLSVVR